MRRRLIFGFLAVFAAFGCERTSPGDPSQPTASASAQVGTLDGRFEPLVSEFDAAAGKLRVVALLSPT